MRVALPIQFKVLFPITYIAVNFLLRRTDLKGSFSLGEASLVSQIIAVLTTHAVNLTYSKAKGSLYLHVYPLSMAEFQAIEPIDVFLVALTLGMILIGVLSIPTLMYTRKSANEKLPVNTRLAGALTFYAFLFGFTFFAISPWVESFIKHEPFTWVFNFINKHADLKWNLVFLSGSLTVGGIAVPWKFRADLMSMSVHIRRKYFHIIALMMFVPSIFLEVRLFSFVI